jgi:hypothetical protein
MTVLRSQRSEVGLATEKDQFRGFWRGSALPVEAFTMAMAGVARRGR